MGTCGRVLLVRWVGLNQMHLGNVKVQSKKNNNNKEQAFLGVGGFIDRRQAHLI